MSRIYLNDNWKFTPEFADSMIRPDYDDSDLETVRLPHTCKEVPFHYFDESLYQMISGYRKCFMAPTEWKDKSVVLTIDGAAHSTVIYLNGVEIGAHSSGYTACSFEIGDALCFDTENILVVRVNSREDQNIPPFGFVIDYMTFGGIYRDVYLDVRQKEYLEDVFVSTRFPAEFVSEPTKFGDARYSAELVSQVKIHSSWLDGTEGGDRANREPLYVRQSLKRKTRSSLMAPEELPLGETEIPENGGSSLEMIQKVEGILLWELDAPCLYELKTELISQGEVVDTRVDTFGFRKAEFRTDGFYLNGNKVKIRGLNRHQSYPYVGYAMPESMQKLDAEILKNELGCNAVRTSHYPQSHYFVDRCDELGLLTFMEIPGWQHIGDDAWKDQAVENVKEMIEQYRNHPSIILWGVRINESQDDDAFYKRTNEVAHQMDPTRPTGGVRAHKKSNLFEDVYTYNDFSHDGKASGCEPKKNVTSNVEKPYLITEYNGHMYPTKAFDWEEHRAEHALRHARVLDAVAKEPDIAGSFGWCMFDYNTHKDFGSGDRICYHGVMDMFRNPKLAALIYASQQEKEPVLELTSSMDIGEHPGCNRGFTYLITNGDSVRMYKNDKFIKEYTRADSPFQNLAHGPMLLDDFIGDELEKNEKFTSSQAREIKDALNYTATHGYGKYPPKIIWTGLKCMLFHHMKATDAVRLYNQYVGDWGGSSTVYRFEAIKDGQVVKTIVKKPMTKVLIHAEASARELVEKNSYDVAEIRIQMLDENGNQLFCCNDPVTVEVGGPLELIGPSVIPLGGGMGGLYVKTTGKTGKASVTLRSGQADPVTVEFIVYASSDENAMLA